MTDVGGPVDLRGFDLNLVPALHALLEERNVTRAAERLSVGQPAMSAALARLRRHFDDPLLVRSGRGYELSIVAESLINPVAEAMSALQAATSTRREFDPATDSRSFTIATSDYAAVVFLRPLLAQLTREAPGVSLRLVPVSLDLGDALRRGAVDLVILPKELAVDLDEFPSAALFDDEFVLAADRNNPALVSVRGLDDERGDSSVVGNAVDRDLMMRLPFVATSNQMQPLVGRRLREQGVELRVDVTTEAFVAAPMLVLATPLVCFVQCRLGRLLAEQAPLRLFRSPVDIGAITETVYWNPRQTNDPASRWLRTQLTLHAEDV